MAAPNLINANTILGKTTGANLTSISAVTVLNNASGSATSGSIVNKFVVSDRNGSTLGYVPVYDI
jgi:hypothetical protein